ncbi:MAG: hypothetical protein ABJH98_14950 [Reichenbachiella sp.]|uniref:hypothetical protein n=1 Tax=Reichenbachiella sp. TaxID=2184521 RepID=UPI003299BFF9
MAYTYDDPKSLGINMNFGYFVLPHHIGIGVSLGINTNFNPNFNLFPLGFELRYLVFNQPSTPYLFCQMRSLVKIGEDFYGGRERGFGLGYKVKLAHATFLTFDLKYNYKTIKNGEGMYASNLSIKGLDFSLGMIF